MGGKAKIPMAELRTHLFKAGIKDVTTYIQSGNIVFSSEIKDTVELSDLIHNLISEEFGLDIEVVVFSGVKWSEIVRKAPKWWGFDESRKHNLLILIPPYDMDEVMRAISELKPGIESAQAGNGVVYQSMSIKLFGRTTTGKLASSSIYKRMTVRNYNTVLKLLKLLD